MPESHATEYRQYRFALPAGATDLLVVRHGESQPARLDRPFPMIDGQADPPLDVRGEAEAELVAERLAREDIAAIYVTPLQRTQQTAAPLAKRLDLEPQVEPNLREVFLGDWEGATFRAKVVNGDPLAQKIFEEERWDVIPGAESTDGFTARIRAGIERIAAAHPDQRVAVFTHGGVIGALAAMVTEARPFAFLGADNASITHIVVTDDRWILRRFNDTGHLDTDLDRPPAPLT
jgi:2,3-bisphosphoglycerate-dependent phosphoglycerate mutase